MGAIPDRIDVTTSPEQSGWIYKILLSSDRGNRACVVVTCVARANLFGNVVTNLTEQMEERNR